MCWSDIFTSIAKHLILDFQRFNSVIYHLLGIP